jgi:hypothetical protein
MSKKKSFDSTGKITDGQAAEMPQAEYLLSLTKTHDKFKDQFDTPYMRFEKDGHFEIHSLRSEAYKNYLIHELYMVYKSKINRGAVADVISIVESEIISTGIVYELHLRVAEHDDCFWYDLADTSWRAIKIDKKGWSIVSNPPILFRRTAHMKEQVEPIKGGDIKRLFDFVNIPPKFQLLLLINIMVCFIPNLDYPINVFWGKPGTGKSTIGQILQSLVDPSKVDTLSFPSTDKEMIQIMSKYHLMVFDNISRITTQISDILCRASTGGAFASRELYKNDDEIIRELHQPVVLNGLYQLGVANDLISRSMYFELEEISSNKMKPKNQFLKRFEQEKPYILGRMFDCVSSAIKNKQAIKIADHDRMGDYKDWGIAIAKNFNGADIAFLKQLAKMDKIRNREALLGQPLANAVEIFINRERYFKGSATTLHKLLCDIAKKHRINTTPPLWPNAANAMTRQLNNMATNLDKAGIRYKHRRVNTCAEVILELI